MTTPTAGDLVGRTLGPYRILERVGEGGMGEVYRAEDLKLGRAVAIKVLPPSFVASPERVKRFEREARAASAINHPSIATIYELGTAEGVHFIAMEFVEGQSLSAWLCRDDLTLPDVLKILDQIGDALARAHEAGVVHRDVKPANVIVSKGGYAKLLDFGLAKVSGESGPYTDSDIRDRLTTKSGVVMGTMAYMSPEQARGQRLDRRTDIFSFGILMYEAVAGAPPFAGASGIEVVSQLLRDDPVPRLRERTGVPRELVRIIAKALEKDPAQRYQFMDDLVVDLREVRRVFESGTPERFEDVSLSARRWLLLGVGLLVGLAAGALVLTRLTAAAPAHESPLMRAGLLMRPLTFGGAHNRSPSISPDGDLVSYASDRSGSFDIMVQQVGTGRPLRVTEDPGDELDPIFSPDGQTLAFSTGDGRIRTVPALGGSARTLAEGGADLPIWSPDGQQVAYRAAGGLLAVSRTGGPSRRITGGAGLPVLDRPAWSPDGRWILFPSLREGRRVLARVPAAAGAAMVVGGEEQALGRPVWSADGRFLFGTLPVGGGRGSEIGALPVDGREARPGGPLRVLGGVLDYESPSVSRDQRKVAFEVRDLLVHVARVPLRPGRVPAHPDRVAVEGRVYEVEVSPTGDALAVVTDRGGPQALWRMPAGGGALEPLREGPGMDEAPAWSPDGGLIAFCHAVGGERRIAVVRASGGPVRLLSPPGVVARDPAWSPDGVWIAFTASGSGGDSLRVVPASAGAERTLTTTVTGLRKPSWSPDGRWIAVGVPGGRGWAVAIVPAQGGALREVLPDARAPLWLADGRLVFAREGQRGSHDLWILPVGPDGTPKARREARLTRLPPGRSIDADTGASTDGRFLYFTLLELASDDVWLGEIP